MKILKFYKDNCGTCDEIENVLLQVSSQFNIPIEYIDNTYLTELAKFYNISSNPSIVLLDDNDNLLLTHTGLLTVEELTLLINKFL